MLEEENQWGNRLTQVHLEKAVKMVSVFYDIVSSPSDQSLKASSISYTLLIIVVHITA